MKRNLDFTSCTTECKKPCWRKLTNEEMEWLKNNANRHSQADFDCERADERKAVVGLYKSMDNLRRKK